MLEEQSNIDTAYISSSIVDTQLASLDYLQNYRKNLLSILERANQISNTTSLDELLNQMLDLIMEVTGSETGSFYLLDPEEGELVYEVVKGDGEVRDMVGLGILHAQGVFGSAEKKLEPLVVDDLRDDPRWAQYLGHQKSGKLRNVISFPLILKEKTIGAVQVFNFVRENLDILQVLGERVASEINKVMLLEKAHRSNHQMKALVDILGSIGATLDREQLLRLVTEHAAQLLQAERTSVFIVDPATSDLAFHVAYQQPTEELGDTVDKQTRLDKIIQNGKPYHNPIDSGKTPRDVTFDHGLGFVARSALTIPLRARSISLGQDGTIEERVIGGVMAFNKQRATFDSEDTNMLEILANQASTMLQIVDLYNDASGLFLDIIKALVAAIDAKDPYTQGHSLRVSEISVSIAKEFALGTKVIHEIQLGSLLHDVGKIGIPDNILLKPGRLTDDEFDEIKKHPLIGHKIMSEVKVLHNMLPAISEHHERLDGSGYPFGLSGDQITLMGKIVAVADVFDAMTSDRPYRKAIEPESVISYLQENAGKLFDADCVEAFVRVYQREES